MSNFSRGATRPNSAMIVEKKLWQDCFAGTSLEEYNQNESVIVITLIDAKVFPKNTPTIENVIINEDMQTGSYVNVGYDSAVEMLIIQDIFFKNIFDDAHRVFGTLENSGKYQYCMVLFYDDDAAYEKEKPSDVFYCRYDYHYRAFLTHKNHSMILLPIDKNTTYIMNTQERMDQLESELVNVRNVLLDYKEEINERLESLELEVSSMGN